jgi:hypothetical protein
MAGAAAGWHPCPRGRTFPSAAGAPISDRLLEAEVEGALEEVLA